MTGTALIDRLSLPVVAAPMFLISGPDLVIECCKNGIVGTFPALNQRSTEGFEEWLFQIETELKKWEEETGKKAAPYGVNLIVHGSNPRLEADLKVCMKHKVPLIITSLGAVKDVVMQYIVMAVSFFMMSSKNDMPRKLKKLALTD